MKHARALIAASLLSACLIITACSGESYGDLPLMMERQVDLIEAAARHLATARNAADIVAVVDRFSADMEQLSPRVERLRARYHEALEFLARGDIPQPLRPVMRRVKNLDNELFRAGAGMMRFSGDPLVEAARRKFDQVMKTVAWRKEQSGGQKP